MTIVCLVNGHLILRLDHPRTKDFGWRWWLVTPWGSSFSFPSASLAVACARKLAPVYHTFINPFAPRKVSPEMV